MQKQFGIELSWSHTRLYVTGGTWLSQVASIMNDLVHEIVPVDWVW